MRSWQKCPAIEVAFTAERPSSGLDSTSAKARLRSPLAGSTYRKPRSWRGSRFDALRLACHNKDVHRRLTRQRCCASVFDAGRAGARSEGDSGRAGCWAVAVISIDASTTAFSRARYADMRSAPRRRSKTRCDDRARAFDWAQAAKNAQRSSIYGAHGWRNAPPPISISLGGRIEDQRASRLPSTSC